LANPASRTNYWVDSASPDYPDSSIGSAILEILTTAKRGCSRTNSAYSAYSACSA